MKSDPTIVPPPGSKASTRIPASAPASTSAPSTITPVTKVESTKKDEDGGLAGLFGFLKSDPTIVPPAAKTASASASTPKLVQVSARTSTTIRSAENSNKGSASTGGLLSFLKSDPRVEINATRKEKPSPEAIATVKEAARSITTNRKPVIKVQPRVKSSVSAPTQVPAPSPDPTSSELKSSRGNHVHILITKWVIVSIFDLSSLHSLA